MSDELLNEDLLDVEGHVRRQENDEPATEDEGEGEDEVEAHVKKSQPKHI
jgi:hypothetical protein